MRDYLFQGLHETRSYSLKEHEAAFLKRQNLIFSIEVGSIAFNFFFSIRVFFTDTDNSQRSRRREGKSFIPLYHFHPLTSIEIFICNFACEMTITYFLWQRLCLPNCYSMRFTTLSDYHLSD